MIAYTKTSADGDMLWISVPIPMLLLEDEEQREELLRLAAEAAKQAAVDYLARRDL